MMWPMRRASFGRAKNCSPASCLPANTSHSLNSALSLPSLAPMRPTTSAWALTTRQSSKRGTRIGADALLDEGRLVDRDEQSRGAQVVRHHVRRSSRATCGSIEPSPAKSGMAIGSGWMVPWVMLSSTTARAGLGHRQRAEHQQPTRQEAAVRGSRSGGIGSWWSGSFARQPARYMSLGSKLRIMSRHSAYLSLGSG